MVGSENDRPTVAGNLVAGNLAFASEPATPASAVLPALRRADMLAELSAAFDLAEMQPAGHAARVTYIALQIAAELGLEPETRERVLYTGLLHDAGVAVRWFPGSEHAGHVEAGAWVASRFDLDEQVQDAIRSTHERWDGSGRPLGLSMTDVPLESRIAAAAHWTCDIADTLDHPLRARAQLQRERTSAVVPIAGTEVAAALSEVLRHDRTWMALSDDRLAKRVAELSSEPAGSSRVVEAVARAMGDVVDSAVREPGRAARVASLAVEMARLVDVPGESLSAVRVAGLLQDIGLLGVPRHITDKPAILSLEEMETMRQHPGWGARIVENVDGMVEIAEWIQGHHERPDGRGYPEMALEGTPLVSRVLGVADAYWALRAERPYRPAFGPREAIDIIESGAGAQFDPVVVRVLHDALMALEIRAA